MQMNNNNNESTIILPHQPCPDCGSSDALCVYSDNHTHCFSCGNHTKGSNMTSLSTKTNIISRSVASQALARNASEHSSSGFIPIKGEYSALKSRKITEETCVKFKYQIGEHGGKVVQIANYYNDGCLQGQKLRTPNKEFYWIGSSTTLYGQNLWKSGGRRVTITEGEIDCLSVAQLQPTWPTVSLPHGAISAKKSIKDNLEWLEGFDEVVFLFDSDIYGEKAAHECCCLLTPGKAKIASLPLKDPSEMLQAGRGPEIINAIWNAKSYLPSGIINAKDLWDAIEKPIEMGLSYPWDILTKLTYGIRPGEIITLGAGTGLGKTTVFKQIAYHILVAHKENIGVFFLEEANSLTALSLMAIKAGRPLHIPGTMYPSEDKQKCFNKLFGGGNVYLFDHFGSTSYEEIKTRIRYLAVSCDVKYIFLDHVTALTSAGEQSDERKAIDAIMTGLSSLVRELNICLFMISHLASPESGGHENGARVTIRQFRGSRSIGQWSNYVFALERDQQAPDETQRHTSTFRVLKDRYAGTATGNTFKLFFDNETQKLIEVYGDPNEQEDNPF